MGRTGAINANVRSTMARRSFFAMNAPDTHQGTQNSCFVTFRNVWVHFGSFHYCNKLGAKWAELVQIMQKFMPRSRVRTFRYELT